MPVSGNSAALLARLALSTVNVWCRGRTRRGWHLPQASSGLVHLGHSCTGQVGARRGNGRISPCDALFFIPTKSPHIPNEIPKIPVYCL
jgi:hypothetical protein